MKKILLSCGVAAMLLANNASAQLIFSEDFEGTSGTALPTGWTQTNVGATLWKTGTNTTLQSTDFPVDAHTRMVGINDDAAGNGVNNTNQFLKTPSIDLSNATSPVLGLDMYYFAGTYQSITESFKIEVSTNGGTTWTVLQTVTGNTVTPWETRYIPLTGCAGQANVMIGFRYNDNSGWLFGAMLDNIAVFNQSANDIAISSLTFPKIALNNTPLSVNFTNLGSATVTSLDMSYTVDGGTAVTQQFTGLNIAPLTTGTVTFSTNVQGFSTTGTHTIAVDATAVNGGTDGNTANNQASVTFTPATQSVTKNGLIEEFSSSTCPPCASFNATFDPLVAANNANVPNSHFNLIKYQMNWPSPNTDRSYNAHGASRRQFYGVSGIPDHYTNGGAGGAGNQAEIDASKAGSAFVDITGTYHVNSNGTLDVSYSVTPYFTLTGNFKIYAAAVQRQYHLQDATTTVGQYNFVYAMRRMFPDGNGTTVSSTTAGTAITGNFNSIPYTINAAPTQGSFDFYSDPVASDLVVFFQDLTTGEVYQSQAIPAVFTVGVANIANDTKVKVFPNPASDYAVVALDMASGANVQVIVTDALGRMTYNTAKQLASGRNDVVIPTSNFAAGIYNVTIRTEKGSLTERLTIAK